MGSSQTHGWLLQEPELASNNLTGPTILQFDGVLLLSFTSISDGSNFNVIVFYPYPFLLLIGSSAIFFPEKSGLAPP